LSGIKDMKPFNTNTTREERQEWFAQTPPWDRVPSPVVDSILDGIADKVMLDAFLLASMEQNLVPRYEALGHQSTPDLIRAQISHILCIAGNQAIALLAKALDMNDIENARKAYQTAMNAFEPAIALAKNQVVAYAGISAAYGMVSKRSESHEYAKRGLAELAEMRRTAPNDLNRVFPPEALDQMEQHLRSLLAW
jgi:tetratricopeptide (TPR) repeat protein